MCSRTGRVINTIIPSWADIGLNRLNESINKDLVARVEVLTALPDAFASPRFQKSGNNLRRVKRWQPGEMRWEINPRYQFSPNNDPVLKRPQ